MSGLGTRSDSISIGWSGILFMECPATDDPLSHCGPKLPMFPSPGADALHTDSPTRS